MMSPQLDTDSINTTASSAKSTTSLRTSNHATEGHSTKHQEMFQGTTRLHQLTRYADIFLEAALDRISALARILGTNSDRTSSFVMSGVSKVTPSWIPAIREGIRGNLLKPLLETEGVASDILSRMLDLGECGLLGVLCSITLLLAPVIELVSNQDCRIIKTCIRLYAVDLFFQSVGLRKKPTEALRDQAACSSDPVIRAALHQHLDDSIGLWWWIGPLVCPIFAAIFGFDSFIALGFSIALLAWSDTRRTSAFQRHIVRLEQLSEEKNMSEITSRKLNAALAKSLLTSREQQVKVEHEKLAALEHQHLKLGQQLQIERVQHTGAIDWYSRTTGVLSDQVRGANKEADNFRHALIDWHKYLTKQNDASKDQIDALETRNEELRIECDTIIARNRVLEEKEAKYIDISNAHNEQNKSLREELCDMNSLVGSLNALVDSTNEKLHQKEEEFTKLEESVQQKQYSHAEEQYRLSANEMCDLRAILVAECDDMLARTRDEAQEGVFDEMLKCEEYMIEHEIMAKAEIDEKVKSILSLEEYIIKVEALAKEEIDEKVKSIVTLEEYIVKKESTNVDMQAEIDKAKAEIDEKVKCIESLERHIQWKKNIDVIVQAKLDEAYAEIKEKNRFIAMLKEDVQGRDTTNVDLQAKLNQAETEIDEKEECIMMLEEHIQEEIDVGVQAELHKAKAEMKEMKETITMREEFMLETEATNIDIQSELDNANLVNLGIVDHLRTLKKTIASQVEGLATKDRINANFETDLRAKNAAIGQLNNDVRTAHADNAILTKHRDRLMKTVHSLSKDLGQLKVTQTLVDQELTECQGRHSRAWRLLKRAQADKSMIQESTRAKEKGLARMIAHLKEELASERANHDTKSKVNAKREASNASKIESMRIDMQALEDENDDLTDIKEWDQVGEDEGEDGDADSDDEMENEIEHTLDAMHMSARSLRLLQGCSMRDESNEQNKHKFEAESTKSRDSVMGMADQRPTTGGAHTRNHDQDDEQDTCISDESTDKNDSEPEVIDSEHSDDEDHLTPSRADLKYADDLNSRWKPVQGGLDIHSYEEISIADTEDSDGELVEITDVDDDE